MVHMWNDKRKDKHEVLGDETVPVCHFVHNISRVDLHGTEPRRRLSEEGEKLPEPQTALGEIILYCVSP